MLYIGLQWFGGRGSGGGNSGGGGSGRALNEEDSQAWSEDPSIYQRLADPSRREAAIDELMEEDGYTREEVNELLSFSNDIRNRAETQTVNNATLYRGERYSSLREAQAKYKPGAEISTTQLTSYSTDKDTAKGYASMYQNQVSVVITNTSTTGKSVGLRTQHYGEAAGKGKEIIVPKGVKSTVKSTRYDKASGILYVTMENSATPKRRKR